MRSLLFSVVLLAGCGGNWSNSDLAFGNALPRREDLRSKLPSGSTAQPLLGVGTRRDGLMVGDPSGAFAATRKAVGDYNGLLDLILGVVDQVRQAAPTSRTAESRTWGPFADGNNPGRQVQVTIVRIDESNFEWSIDSRANAGAFIRVLTGNFKASDTTRRGQGSIVMHVKDFRDVVKLDERMKELDEIKIGYVTDMFPKRVEMLFTVSPGSTIGISSLGYTAREQQDGSGSIRFVYALTRADVPEVEINAAWKPTGEGKGTGLVTKGMYAGANVAECWGKNFAVVYYSESWPAGVTSGVAGDCPVIEGL